jgi:hypothetical protein
MYYDDSGRRLNLLGGLAVGAALGAGLALLLLPDEQAAKGKRVVVRAARGVGRGARWTFDTAADGAKSLRDRASARAEEAHRVRPGERNAAGARALRSHVGLDVDAELDALDRDDAPRRPSPDARERARQALARRKFRL